MIAIDEEDEKIKENKKNIKQQLLLVKMQVFISIVLLPFSTVNAFAEDVIQLEKGSIIGNSESLKATFIVPWREITPIEIKGLEIGALLDEELKTIKPEVFRRQVELHQIQASITNKRNIKVKENEKSALIK